MTERKLEQMFKKAVPKIVLQEASDDDDNRFLECAQASKANYLVTGNTRHFPRAWKYTKIVQPKEFLMLWQVQKPLGDKV